MKRELQSDGKVLRRKRSSRIRKLAERRKQNMKEKQMACRRIATRRLKSSMPQEFTYEGLFDYACKHYFFITRRTKKQAIYYWNELIFHLEDRLSYLSALQKKAKRMIADSLTQKIPFLNRLATSDSAKLKDQKKRRTKQLKIAVSAKQTLMSIL